MEPRQDIKGQTRREGPERRKARRNLDSQEVALPRVTLHRPARHDGTWPSRHWMCVCVSVARGCANVVILMPKALGLKAKAVWPNRWRRTLATYRTLLSAGLNATKVLFFVSDPGRQRGIVP